MNTHLVYITAGSMDEARRIGRRLVSTRLAACINILGPMQSIYAWEGSLEETAEVVLIAKTEAKRLDELTGFKVFSDANPGILLLLISTSDLISCSQNPITLLPAFIRHRHHLRQI